MRRDFFAIFEPETIQKVNLQERILAIRNERNFAAQQQHFEQNQAEISELISFISDEHPYPFPEYASWILTHLARKNKALIEPFQHQLTDFLFETENQSVLRNLVNTLSGLKLTDYRESELVDLLISYIQNHENKVALQVYSMQVLLQFVQKYPELKQEIIEVIELNQEGKSPAYFAGKRHFEAKVKKY